MGASAVDSALGVIMFISWLFVLSVMMSILTAARRWDTGLAWTADKKQPSVKFYSRRSVPRLPTTKAGTCTSQASIWRRIWEDDYW